MEPTSRSGTVDLQRRQPPIYEVVGTNPPRFVAFWSAQYAYKGEHLYADNIGKPLTPERVRELFIWKNGSRLSERKQESVERNYIARIDEVNRLPSDTDAEAFLEMFPTGGAIWRIFWLHCWNPHRFPIYDQHVHRAMRYIQTGEPQEIPQKDPEKVAAYLNEYLPFYRQFDEADPIKTDRALWAMGRFIREWQL